MKYLCAKVNIIKEILFITLVVAEVKCDHPTSTKDGFIEVSNFRGSYIFGSRATYHCNPGYILWGNSTRLCDSSGQWTGYAPRCRPISCGDPPMLPHTAVALLNGSTQWKSIAVYSCLPGYTTFESRLCTYKLIYQYISENFLQSENDFKCNN